MKMTKKLLAVAILASGTMLATPGFASAIITNGTITLGVNDEGHLNVGGGTPSLSGTTAVGLRYNATGAESTAPGCLCEGWGVGIASSGIAGYANVDSDGGAHNLSLVSFSSTADTVTSVTRVSIGGTDYLEVTHYYHPSSVANLYQDDVTIKNLGADLAAGDLVYRRVMDWDIEPTPFSERVTIGGVPSALGLANGNNVRQTDNNGFNSANPFNFVSYGEHNVNFTDSGPRDHGALFDFEFEALTTGASRAFTTFYGAAGNEVDALAALAAVGSDLYSLGETSTASTPIDGAPNTFIFGFGSRGGILTPPPSTDVPEPSSLALLAAGMLGLVWKRRRTA